jgi:uncharacterized protein (TIGR02266 family)
LRDNRKSDRVESRLRCWCEGDNVTFYARVDNISEGGIFLRTSTPLEAGAEAKVRLEIDEEQIHARAVVVWARGYANGGPPGMGLRFREIDGRGLASLRRIIENEARSRHSGD